MKSISEKKKLRKITILLKLKRSESDIVVGLYQRRSEFLINLQASNPSIYYKITECFDAVPV